MARRQVSEGRKATYYAGMGLGAVGLLLFSSPFVTFALSFGQVGPDMFPRMAKAMALAFFGFGLIFVGGILTRIGLLGPAGAGVILDPERAREDIEPLARMAGGIVGDALDEAHVNLGQTQAPPERVVMVKCGACGTLNDEDAKFCKECGQAL